MSMANAMRRMRLVAKNEGARDEHGSAMRRMRRVEPCEEWGLS